ncbi:hypothetical protein V1478_018360, partial [Vespula squamosa]
MKENIREREDDYVGTVSRYCAVSVLSIIGKKGKNRVRDGGGGGGGGGGEKRHRRIERVGGGGRVSEKRDCYVVQILPRPTPPTPPHLAIFSLFVPGRLVAASGRFKLSKLVLRCIDIYTETRT